eukprot:CAMPEP_0171873580 /NCGR_PEP_ID=MMETSP0992-20121227/34479_1 /TAXON_ID=483369 /ORGANISM="non described non described, Strain CCMP2098" /LENGTH=121 /DNA_ID=CAMNT_0012498253 /DNA_START=190 /DNA_END=551 /DNA_ORIENTATION=-
MHWAVSAPTGGAYHRTRGSARGVTNSVASGTVASAPLHVTVRGKRARAPQKHDLALGHRVQQCLRPHPHAMEQGGGVYEHDLPHPLGVVALANMGNAAAPRRGSQWDSPNPAKSMTHVTFP